jgi:hypothetical protein
MSLNPRPRFDFRIRCTPEEAEACVRRALDATTEPIEGSQFKLQCEIKVKDDVRHIWSPHMSVIFETRQDGTYATGHVGPDLPIWSLFITLYGALGIFAMTGLVFGYSQMTLNQDPWGFLLGGVSMLAVAVLYGIGKVGETLARPQTLIMHAFLHETLATEKVPELKAA